MELEFNPSLNFGAKLIKRTSVGRCNQSKEFSYEPLSGCIVEIEPNLKKDKKAVDSAVSTWGEYDWYGHSIAEDINSGILQKQKGKVYAMTLQNSDFDNLDGELIIGLSEVIPKGKNKQEIKFLQASPIKNKSGNKKEYINVGQSFIDMLKKNPLNFRIIVQASYNAANFYEKMKFRIIDTDKLIYLWEKDQSMIKYIKATCNKRHYKKLITKA